MEKGEGVKGCRVPDAAEISNIEHFSIIATLAWDPEALVWE